MKTDSFDIADFYRQIALLLKSGLPLPESIYQLGLNFDKADFKKVLFDISENTSKGVRLSDAMKDYPEYFKEFHVKMIEAGEDSEMLPETFNEIANTAHLNLQLTSMVRGLMLYPVFAIGFTYVVVFSLFTYIVPHFKAMFEEMFQGEPLPALTEFIVFLGDIFLNNKLLFALFFVLYVIFFIWLFGGAIVAKRIFMKIISLFPGAGDIFYNLSMARLCGMWSVLMLQKTGAADSMNIIASLIENRAISKALLRVADSVRQGSPPADTLEYEKFISGIVPLTLRHVPEKELPAEFANLAVLFREKASAATRKAGTIWAILLLIFLSVTIGTVIIGMFLPLIQIIKRLGGG